MATKKPVTLRPGLLVSLRTTVRGGVEYKRVDLDAGTTAGSVEPTEGEAPRTEVARWETTRVVTDAQAYERAKKCRSKASSLIRGACVQSAFGLVCPASDEDKLDAAYAEALAMVEAHNAGEGASRVDVWMLKGRVAQSDELAAKAVAAEVAELIEAMRVGLAKADVAAIREAAAKARDMGKMLDEEAAAKVGRAVEEARSAAKAIVRRVQTDGEDAALVIQELSRKALDEARFAFLDLDGAEAPEARTPLAIRAMESDAAAEVAPSAPAARQVEVL